MVFIMPKQPDAIFSELRKQEINDLVNTHGKVTVNELCQHFFVSPATIRNDLNELDLKGKLKRTHGGAISNNRGANYEPTSKEKEEQYTLQKRSIAQAALAFVHEGDAIIIDTGTTTYEFAKLLIDIPDLTVVTNDLVIASFLEQCSNANVILLGGSVRKHFHCTVGKTVLDMMDNLHIDTAFMASNGINKVRGLSTPSIEMANIKQKMINIAEKTILLADSSKIDKDALIFFAPLDDIDILITDKGADEKFLNAAESYNISVIVSDEE